MLPGAPTVVGSSLRARTTAPRMATRMRTLVTSKGRMRRVKRMDERSVRLLTKSSEPPRWALPRLRDSRKKDVGEEAENGEGAGDAGEIGGAGALGVFFFAGVEQHDDEDEEDHDGTGVDDDLGGGEELSTERPVKDGERHHDDDERQGGVDGVLLQEEVESPCDGERGEDDEEGELHELGRDPVAVRGDCWLGLIVKHGEAMWRCGALARVVAWGYGWAGWERRWTARGQKRVQRQVQQQIPAG